MLPPAVGTNFVVTDEGNASPRFVRMSINNVPATGDMLNTSHLPLAAIFQPLADLPASEVCVPARTPSSFSSDSPPLCRSPCPSSIS
jgi:protein transport protein SEC24